MRVYRATSRTQWKTTPRQKIGPGRRRRVPWKIFKEHFKREAARS